MTALDSLPSRPLDRDTVLALNGSEAEMVVLPISYYKETQIYSMAIFTDEHAVTCNLDTVDRISTISFPEFRTWSNSRIR